MAADKLKNALDAVDWKANVKAFLDENQAVEETATANLRLAVWSKQLEAADCGNPALSFVREMQIAGQYVAVLVALSLYKAAAGSMRSVLETALYYSYFRSHPAELATLARKEGFYLEKNQILDFHKVHTNGFSDLQKKMGLNSRLEVWYSDISAVIHGQIPGTWIDHQSVSQIHPIKTTEDSAIKFFVEGVEIVHRLFLCTVGRELWDSFSGTAKKQLLSGLHGDLKKALQLDEA